MATTIHISPLLIASNCSFENIKLIHPMYLSVVLTSLNEQQTIEDFVGSLIDTLEGINQRYEIILVNDGSMDKTLDAQVRLLNRYSQVSVVLDLMKNAGQAAAITAGLAETRGEYVLMIDSDMQLFPDDIGLFLNEVRRGADIVNGYRVMRRDSLGRRLPSVIANWVMRRIANARIRDFGCTYRWIDRRLLDAFHLGPERILNVPLLISRAGQIAEVPVRHRQRSHGKSGWTFRKLWQYHGDNMIIMAEPIFQGIGVICIGIAFLFILRTALDPLLHWSFLGNVTNGLILNAIASATLLLVGILSLVGEFIVRSHKSILARPAYVVRRRLIRDVSSNNVIDRCN